MKTFFIMLSIALISPAEASVDACPSLPSDSNLEWQYREGPDFDLCYAHEPGSAEIAFGIYLGNFPAFQAQQENEIGPGVVGGRKVTWYRSSRSANGQETLVTIGTFLPEVAHVWVNASSEAQIRHRLSLLERLVIKSGEAHPASP